MSFPFELKEMMAKAFRQSGTNTSVSVTVDPGSPIPIEFAENIAVQILKSPDRNKVFSWADFGSKNERVTSVVYTAPSVGAYILTKTFSYSLSGNAYRLDSETLVLTGA